MISNRGSGEPRPEGMLLLDIIDGGSWTARRVHNNVLRQHCHQMARHFGRRNPAVEPLLPWFKRLARVILEMSHVFTVHHPRDFPMVPVMLRFCAYRGQWMREPESWGGCEGTPQEVMKSLAEHLFVVWPMPDFFFSAWLVKGELNYLERDWYCLLAAGGSWRSADGMPGSVSSRALHLAMRAPSGLTVRQALRWGQLMACGASQPLMDEVLASRMVRDLSNDRMWSKLLLKVVAATWFDPRDFGLVADALLGLIGQTKHGEAERLVGRPLREILSFSRRYWKEVMAMDERDVDEFKRHDMRCPHLRENLSSLFLIRWERFAPSMPFEAGGADFSSTWRVIELTSAGGLMSEGRAMRHCVHSYRKRCVAGTAAIFSLRKIDELGVWRSVRTIEVERESREIVQIRGKWNWWWMPEGERLLIVKWAEVLGLRIRRGCRL